MAKDNASWPITVELVEEPPQRGQNGNGHEKTYRLTIDAGRVTEPPYEGLLLKDLAKTVTEKSKLVELMETAKADTLLPGTYWLNVPSVEPAALTQEQVEGDEATCEGLGGVTAVEEVTMVCVPDLMAMLNGANGDITKKETIVRAVQSKIVEGCENVGQRWRSSMSRRIASPMKCSTGFWVRSRFQVRHDVLAMDRGARSDDEATDHGPAVRPRSRHLVPD